VNLTETVIFTCTNREAENYGRFLRELLFDLSKWYTNKSIYDKEAIGPSTPGFLKKWSVNPSEAIYLQYEEFRSVMFKWHKFLTVAFRNCLESRDYMHVRNALAVLEKISGQFPQVDSHGAMLEANVNSIASKAETRGDLQVRAQGYLALLRKSSKSWVTAARFSAQTKSAASPANSSAYITSTAPRGQTSLSNSASSSALESQHSEKGKSALNPSAPTFKPHEIDHR
jgi:THO complex subunit 2